jgi:fructokinase
MNPIVGIGELLWDIYPDGRKVAGGAPFNFAFHCHQLGHPAVIVSRVGDDDLGRELRAEVRRLGLSDEYIQTDPDHPTGTVRVALDANKVPTYTITENVAWDCIAWDERLEKLAGEAAAVCFGTLARRAIESRVTVKLLLVRCQRADGGAIRICDPNLRPPAPAPEVVRDSIRSCNWLKADRDEMACLLRELPTEEGLDSDAVERFRRAHGLACLCVTEGKRGCTVVAEGEKFTEPGVPARVVDTVGAGDAFTAAMVCLHLEGRPLRECARFANHYAARVCEHQGATPRIDRAEVERAAFG